MAQFQLRKAERKRAKLKIGIFGPSGAGKTMSALRLARGITTWDKIAVIDTENGSADLYSHLGEYNAMTLEAPFNPERYIQAIQTCVQAGMEVIIIDSITHEWAGQGGILELSDELGKAAKNSFAVWGKLTPRHNRFINTILESEVHFICCGRSKQDYVMNEVEKNGKKVNVPEKIGLKAVTREGFDYEMTIAFDIAINHYATTSKDRTGLFMMEPEFMISEKTGEKLVEWNLSGKVDQPTPTQNSKFLAQLKTFKITQEEWFEKMKENPLVQGKQWAELSEEKAQQVLDIQDKRIAYNKEQKETENTLDEFDKKDDESPKPPPAQQDSKKTPPVSSGESDNVEMPQKDDETPQKAELKPQTSGMKKAKEAWDSVKKEEGVSSTTQEEEINVEDIPF